MKKILLSLICIASLLQYANAAGSYVTFLNGTQYTNATQILQTGTNSWTTNQIGVVLGASTNTYNLYPGLGTQLNPTNWPSAGTSPQGNYPGTLEGPYNNMAFYTYAQLQATNASSTALVFQYAGSIDGYNWVTNYFSQTYTVAVNTLTPGPVITNITTGGVSFIALYQIQNPGVSAVTNIIIEADGKPGL